jgi:hypothetical protein
MRSRTATLLQTNALACHAMLASIQNLTRIENMKVPVINRKYNNTIIRPPHQTPIPYSSHCNSPLPDHTASHPTSSRQSFSVPENRNRSYSNSSTLLSSHCPPPQARCCLSVRPCATPLLDNDWSTPSVTVLAHSRCSGDVLPAHRPASDARDRCV